MKHILLCPPVAALLCGGSALASTVNATSEIAMFHSYTINSGSVPEGVRLTVVPGGLALGSGSDANLDDPAAVTTEVPFVQIANPFLDPPIPYIASRITRTTVNGGLEGSQAQFNLSLLAVDDPDANPFDTSIVERRLDTTGAARIFLSRDNVAADANSDYLIDRRYAVENESDEIVSFNIVGEVTANLLASHDGTVGFARTNGNLFLEFEDLIGTGITYLPIAPYLRSIDDADSGASVAESLVISSEGYNGFNFSVAATAVADGTAPAAAFDGSFRYLFQVQMDPGASFSMFTGSRQINAVEYPAPDDLAPIPLPASLPLLLAGIGGLIGLSRRADRAKSVA